MGQFRAARIEVVTQSEIQGETPGNSPIVLHKSTDIPVPPMAKTFGELRWRAGRESGIDTDKLCKRSIDGEEKRIEEVVDRASRTSVAVLVVTAQFCAGSQAVFPVRERNQIRVVVRAFSDDCAGRRPVAKTHDDVVRKHARHARQRNRADTRIEQVTRTELVQQRGTESVNEADLKIRSGEGDWIGE